MINDRLRIIFAEFDTCILENAYGRLPWLMDEFVR
jgi:hypothetical protein